MAEPTPQPDRRMRRPQPVLQTVWICKPFRRLASLIRTDRLTSEESAIQHLRMGSGRLKQSKCGRTASGLADPPSESPVYGPTTAVPGIAQCW